MERWGRGTLKIVELAQQAGLPRPEFEDAGGCVTVRFRQKRYVPPQRVARELTDLQRAILAAIDASAGGLALRDIRAELPKGTPEWQVKQDLATLKALGLVGTAGHARGAFWYLTSGSKR